MLHQSLLRSLSIKILSRDDVIFIVAATYHLERREAIVFRYLGLDRNTVIFFGQCLNISWKKKKPL